jgi:hypothetical protein
MEWVLERIPHRSEDDVLVGMESLAGRAGATPAATDQAHAERVGVLLGKEWSGQKCGRGQHAAGQSRSFEKFPA